MSDQKNPGLLGLADDDPTAFSRKRDHIELAFRSQVSRQELDRRFYYEPILSGHPGEGSLPEIHFLNKALRSPLWVSSMTGGTDWANTINHNLARACRDFGMGMGLGSCRSLLTSDEHLQDFDVRSTIGPDLPLFANLGVAQLEELLDNQLGDQLFRLVEKLSADGLIIHVNPLQEWLQPEGDRFRRSPLQTIEAILELVDFPIIVKEVGQGMGYQSLKALLQLPLAAIDFAANGGTNFAKLELLRSEPEAQENYGRLALLGHSPEDMVQMTNQLVGELGEDIRCSQIIISGGIKHFLDGYYCIKKVELPAVYGMASAFLAHARGAYDDLASFIEGQIRGLELCQAFLKIRE